MVHTPYTPFFGDAFMAAHVAIGVVLVCLLWSLRPKPLPAGMLLLGSILLATTAPLLGEFLRGFGAKTAGQRIQEDALLGSSVLIVFALLLLRRFVKGAIAVVVSLLLVKLQVWLEESTAELCALQLVWIALVLGMLWRAYAPPPRPAPRRRPELAHDLAIFCVATVAATLASIFVLSRADGSADEWAYTWQAAAFAKLHLYGAVPPCETAFQNFYVFQSMGRWFAQYTPGWPYFMAPFVAVGAAWLAGPVAHGLMAVGVARVARTATRLDGRADTSGVLAASWVAGIVATFGTTILLVGASRYPHVFVAALFAWATHALLTLCNEECSRGAQLRWGVVLGSCVSLMGATRPADGATLSVGLAIYFLYSAARRRVPLAAFVSATCAFFVWSALTLVILRAQLGAWFTTGYSLEKIIHPWNVVKYGWPRPSEWKFALPLATGSYAWFPCSIALGWAGLASLRGRASGLLCMMLLSFLAFEVYYQYVDLGRGVDWGYGPRYETPFVVWMAAGTGVALAPLFQTAVRHFSPHRALHGGGPAAVVLCVMLVTLVRLWPLMYPGVYAHVHQHDSLNQRIRDIGIHHAVVMAQVGTTGFDPLDLTENLPIDLYPNQDVLIAIERKPEFTQCVHTHFPDRTLYRANGNPVTITPY